MSRAVVAILTLIIGVLLGLALGFFIANNRKSSSSASDSDLATARAERDLYKSERDNAMAGSKLATEVEAMKIAMEKLQKEAADADRRRIEAESDIRTQVRAMSTHNESLVAQTKAIAGALSNSQTRGKFGEAQLELMLEDAGLHKGIEYSAQRSTTDTDSSRCACLAVLNCSSIQSFHSTDLSRRMKLKIRPSASVYFLNIRKI